MAVQREKPARKVFKTCITYGPSEKRQTVHVAKIDHISGKKRQHSGLAWPGLGARRVKTSETGRSKHKSTTLKGKRGHPAPFHLGVKRVKIKAKGFGGGEAEFDGGTRNYNLKKEARGGGLTAPSGFHDL